MAHLKPTAGDGKPSWQGWAEPAHAGRVHCHFGAPSAPEQIRGVKVLTLGLGFRVSVRF